MTGSDKLQAGFAYMALLVVISASLLMLGAAMPDIYQTAKREREAQFFFVGGQYQQAIQHFYENPTVSIKRYPETLDELLVDNRSLQPQHHLRRLYADPIRQTHEWGLVLNEQDQIMGVYSLSQNKLLKTHFDSERVKLVHDEGDIKYSDLKFVYLPAGK